MCRRFSQWRVGEGAGGGEREGEELSPRKFPLILPPEPSQATKSTKFKIHVASLSLDKRHIQGHSINRHQTI